MTRSQAPNDATVTIVIPAKNEEQTILDTLDALPVATLETMGLDVTVHVLDGDSHDRTAKIAERWGATVHPDEGVGKGAALKNARHRFDGAYVVMLDADGTYAPDAIPRLLAPILHGEADLVNGTRNVQPGAMKPTHRVGNALLSAKATALYAERCPDLCTGMWAFRGHVLDTLPLECSGFELEAELFAMASRLNLDTEHVTVDYLPRGGKANLSGRRDGVRIAWWLVRSRFKPLPDPTLRPPRGVARSQEGAR